MSAQHKVLLLDDDEMLLEIYKELLCRLPSKPEIFTVTSGARAIALLDSDDFTLLLSDLNMPKMDGLQVLTIVRRKFPHLRTAVMTSVVDEHFRARAYEMGVDLYLEKPNTSQEIQFFLDCIESLLGKESSGGFRGVQSKSLVDIIQLECLSQSSSVLKFTNGSLVGRIWINNGEVIDADFQDLPPDTAFQKILSWRSGNFEALPAEPNRERRIFNSYQGLLLEASQAIDEAKSAAEGSPDPATPDQDSKPGSIMAEMGRVSGVEFVITIPENEKQKIESYGIENADRLAAWARGAFQGFQGLGEELRAGDLVQLEMTGMQSHVVVVSRLGRQLCIGLNRSISTDLTRDAVNKVIAKWVS